MFYSDANNFFCTCHIYQYVSATGDVSTSDKKKFHQYIEEVLQYYKDNGIKVAHMETQFPVLRIFFDINDQRCQPKK